MPITILDLDAALPPGDTCDTLWCRFLHRFGAVDDGRVERCERVARQYRAGTVVPEDYALAQAALLSGRTQLDLQALCRRFATEVIRPRLPEALRQLLQQHRCAGDKLLMTGAASGIPAQTVAAELGIETWLGTEFIWFEGRCSGLLHGHAAMRAHKLERVRHWLHGREGSDAGLRRITVYASSINDLALLSAVGRPVVVDPSARLAATAMRKGWRVLHLHRAAPQAQAVTPLQQVQQVQQASRPAVPQT